MTDTPARRRGPYLSLSGLEWKLVLTAALSAVYAFSFVAVARPTPPLQSAAVTAQMTPASVAASVQPARFAPTATTPATAPRAAQPRIRTRSS